MINLNEQGAASVLSALVFLTNKVERLEDTIQLLRAELEKEPIEQEAKEASEETNNG